jgi:hypothetical protein
MHRIADHALVQIPDLDGNLALGVRDRPEVARVTVAANPYGCPAATSRSPGFPPTHKNARQCPVRMREANAPFSVYVSRRARTSLCQVLNIASTWPIFLSLHLLRGNGWPVLPKPA